jgi:hypothetical protein
MMSAPYFNIKDPRLALTVGKLSKGEGERAQSELEPESHTSITKLRPKD